MTIKKYLQKIKKENTSINAFLEINPNAEKESGKKGKLAGKVIGVKANINVKGLHASCASKTLEDYKATYDATVVKKIKDEGGVIIGMCNMDEFASGSSGETSAFGPTKNPVDTDLVPGGSCSGSAAAVAADFCDMTLGSDTGGSIRNPASHCGVVGIKPTYSSVSRYGLIDLAMSLDVIGPFAKNVSDAALLLSVIMGKDDCDSVSQSHQPAPRPPHPGLSRSQARSKLNGAGINLANIDNVPKKLKVGVLDLGDLKVDAKIAELVESKIKEAAEKYGWELVPVKINHLDLAVETYYPLVYVEAFSGTRKLDGRRYGKKVEDSCGPEFLRRILGGAEISQAEHKGRYYHLALKAKKLFSDEIEKVFGKVDCIISPVVPKLPHKIGSKISVEEMYNYDALTIPYSLAGNCAMSVPCGKINAVPVGMQIACNSFCDEKMLQIARSIEWLMK